MGSTPSILFLLSLLIFWVMFDYSFYLKNKNYYIFYSDLFYY
jgi:hypothetical protein